MTPRTPGTPYPVQNTAAVNDLLMLMKTNLNTLGATFDSLGEQSAKVATLGPAMDTAHQIHQLRRQMRNQEKVWLLSAFGAIERLTEMRISTKTRELPISEHSYGTR